MFLSITLVVLVLAVVGGHRYVSLHVSSWFTWVQRWATGYFGGDGAVVQCNKFHLGWRVVRRPSILKVTSFRDAGFFLWWPSPPFGKISEVSHTEWP